jgi:hypothetical protein
MARTPHAASLVATAVLVTATAGAADPTPKECLGANDTAISLRSGHKLRAARERLLVCAAPSCPADIRNECTRRVADVMAAIPTIVFEAKDVSGKDVSAVKVSVDGEPLATQLDGTALSIDPGVHMFSFETAGQPKIEKQLVIREGQKGRHEPVTFGSAGPVAPAPVVAPPAPVAAEKPKTTAPTEPAPTKSVESSGLGAQKTAAIVVAGVGVVGVGIGAAFGLRAMSKFNQANAACPGDCPDQNGVDLWKSTTTAGNIATAGFIVGGVGLAAGAALWFTAKPSASTEVSVGPGSIELKGSW